MRQGAIAESVLRREFGRRGTRLVHEMPGTEMAYFPEMKTQRRFLLTLTSICIVATAPAAADDALSPIIFPMKTFTDTGNIVHVEGALTGDGIAYKNNWAVLTCFRQTRECELVQINTLGRQVFSVYIPMIYTVRVWTPDRIVADMDESCGPYGKPHFQSETWIVDRRGNTVEMIKHACNEAKPYRWTIENPAYWKKPGER